MTRTPPDTVGKTAGAESFPVATRFLGRRARAVRAFYRWARAADDIADDPRLAPDTRLAQLDALEADLPADLPGREHLRNLLVAFRRDALDGPCPDWPALMDSCAWSAVPVGRFLLDLYGVTDGRAVAASDALCSALQVLNHVQDAGRDQRILGRSYVPADWLADEGLTPAALAEPAASPAVRRVLNHTVGGGEDLLARARPLPRLVPGGLRRQAAATLVYAGRLARNLRRADPLAGRVGLTRGDRLAALGAALFPGRRRS